MALHFEQVSLASLPANLLAAPAIAPVMWLGVLAAAAAQIARAAGGAVHGADRAAAGLRPVGRARRPRAAAALGGRASTRRPRAIAAGVAWRSLAAAALASGAGAAHGPRRRRGTRRAHGGARRLAVASRGRRRPALAIVGRRRRATPRRRRAPGRARRLVPRHRPGRRDADPARRRRRCWSTPARPTGRSSSGSRRRASKRLDALMLTHAEADHEGAAPAVIARVPRRGWSSTAARAGRRAVQRALPTRARARPRARVTPAAGQRSPSAACASRSCGRRRAGLGPRATRTTTRWCAACEVGAFSMLLTADAESQRDARRSTLEPVDVLKVAHHGSADPGLPALLERLRPRVAAIEVGRRNTYGHPTPSTLAALKRAVPTVCAPTGRHRAPACRAAAGCGWSDGPQADEPRRGHDAGSPRARRQRVTARSRNRHPSVRSDDTVAAVSRIPSRKGLLNREIASPCGHGGGRWRSARWLRRPRTPAVDDGRDLEDHDFRGPAGGNDEVIELKNNVRRAGGHRRLAALGLEQQRLGAERARHDHGRARRSPAGAVLPVRPTAPGTPDAAATSDLLDRHLR